MSKVIPQIQVLGAPQQHTGVQILVILPSIFMVSRWSLIQLYAVIGLVQSTGRQAVQVLVSKRWPIHQTSRVGNINKVFLVEANTFIDAKWKINHIAVFQPVS